MEASVEAGTEISISKSARKKNAEAILYLWGVFGMIFVIYLSHGASQREVMSFSNQDRSVIPIVTQPLIPS